MIELTLHINIEVVDELSNDAIARIYYPDEGNKIQIVKGLNAIEFSEAIHHEIGHLFDWYLTPSNQQDIRESNATRIGHALRFRDSLD